MTEASAPWRWPVRALLVGVLLVLPAGPAQVQAHGTARPGDGRGRRPVPPAPPQYQSLQNPATSAMDAKRGARYYFRNCAKCHGNEGQGTKEDPGVVIFADDGYLSTRSDGQLFYVIKFGAGKDSDMVAFGNGSDVGMSDREIWQTVTYIRTLAW